MIRAIVIGAGGYAGGELVSILLSHGAAEPVGLFGSPKKGEEAKAVAFGTLFPQHRGRTALTVSPLEMERALALDADAVFLATPHVASMELAPKFLEAGVKVFDLSGAFRLGEPGLYPKHYGFDHAEPALLRSAVYGLSELNRDLIREADLVAVPGCYPTSAILAIAPLVRAGAIEKGRRPIIDSTSGVSGAGRQALAKTSFCEVSLQAYDVLHHRHTPEIDRHCGTPVVFTPHLGAYDRGILSTIHVDLAPGWDGAKVRGLYEKTYAGEAFVRVLEAGAWPSVAGVRGTNCCDIGLAVDEAHRHLIVESAIDNLVKGAAGQAVQCMNVRYGLPETAGLMTCHEIERAVRS